MMVRADMVYPLITYWMDRQLELLDVNDSSSWKLKKFERMRANLTH